MRIPAALHPGSSSTRLFRSRLTRHTIKGATSLDYVIGRDEAALRDGRWQPENAAELLAAIDNLRFVVNCDDVPRETVAVAALRVGRLHTEAVAKGHWPVVAIGRTHRRQMREAGRLRHAETQKRRENLARLVAQYRTKHPAAGNTEIARAINKLRPRGISDDALRKQIARLKK
jgi:hypothetical protein